MKRPEEKANDVGAADPGFPEGGRQPESERYVGGDTYKYHVALTLFRSLSQRRRAVRGDDSLGLPDSALAMDARRDPYWDKLWAPGSQAVWTTAAIPRAGCARTTIGSPSSRAGARLVHKAPARPEKAKGRALGEAVGAAGKAQLPDRLRITG